MVASMTSLPIDDIPSVSPDVVIHGIEPPSSNSRCSLGVCTAEVIVSQLLIGSLAVD